MMSLCNDSVMISLCNHCVMNESVYRLNDKSV